jgi:hypothetical protein
MAREREKERETKKTKGLEKPVELVNTTCVWPSAHSTSLLIVCNCACQPQADIKTPIPTPKYLFPCERARASPYVLLMNKKMYVFFTSILGHDS